MLPVRTRTMRLRVAHRLTVYRTVAWSRGGTIASIRPDGLSLEFRALRCHPDNGSWGLSEKTTTDIVKGTPTNPLVHLEWSGTSVPELAVIDSVGRVTLMNFSISLNSPFVSRTWDSDSVDDVNTVVGCHWLPVAPPNQQVGIMPDSEKGITNSMSAAIQHPVRPGFEARA